MKAIDLGGHKAINVRCGLGQVLVKGAGIYEHLRALQQGDISVLACLSIHIFRSFGIVALSLSYLNFWESKEKSICPDNTSFCQEGIPYMPSSQLRHWVLAAGRGSPGAVSWLPPSFRTFLVLTLKLPRFILLRRVEFSYSQSKLQPF